MNNLLLFTLQATFYIYGTMGLILSVKCLINDDSSHNVFFISSALSFIIGYFLHFLLQNTFKLRYFLKTIFFSWFLLILVSSIPFLSLIQELNLSSIIFIPLTILALQLTLADKIPVVGYYTLMDYFFLCCFITSMICSIQSGIVYALLTSKSRFIYLLFKDRFDLEKLIQKDKSKKDQIKEKISN